VTRNILAARNVEQLRTLASSGALLAFDFDGTLAPFGLDPLAVHLRDETAELLRSLAHASPVAVITGRSVHDVTSRLEGISFVAVIGNHGAEPSRFAKRAAREVAAWMPQLRALVATLPGVEIEDKVQSVSVHYAHATDPAAVIEALEALAPTLVHAVRVVHGTRLVNYIPQGAPDKGDALSRVVKAQSLPAALFVGDELTDEPAFRTAASGAGFGVRVGEWKQTAARYHIASQLDIDALLTELLIGRTRPTRSGQRVDAFTGTGQTGT
jgi:trehalose 6-phosphate phosphatase